jgi:hypothetical protein
MVFAFLRAIRVVGRSVESHCPSAWFSASPRHHLITPSQDTRRRRPGSCRSCDDWPRWPRAWRGRPVPPSSQHLPPGHCRPAGVGTVPPIIWKPWPAASGPGSDWGREKAPTVWQRVTGPPGRFWTVCPRHGPRRTMAEGLPPVRQPVGVRKLSMAPRSTRS